MAEAKTDEEKTKKAKAKADALKPKCTHKLGKACANGEIKVGGLFYHLEHRIEPPKAVRNEKVSKEKVKITRSTACHPCMRAGLEFSKVLSSGVIESTGVARSRRHKRGNPEVRTNERAPREKTVKEKLAEANA